MRLKATDTADSLFNNKKKKYFFRPIAHLKSKTALVNLHQFVFVVGVYTRQNMPIAPTTQTSSSKTQNVIW